MQQMKFSLANLGDLDLGIVNAAFSVHVERIVKDCADRPLETKPRQIAVLVNFAPVADSPAAGGHIDLHSVNVSFDIQSKTPPHTSKVYPMRPKNDNTLVFRPDESTDDPGEDKLYDPNVLKREREAREGQ